MMLKGWEGMEEISVKSSIWWIELHLKNKLSTICLRWWSRCTYLIVVYFDYKVQKVEFKYKEQVLSTGSLWSQVLQLLQPGGVPLFPGANHGAVTSWWVRSGNLDMIRRNWNGKEIKRCTMKRMVFHCCPVDWKFWAAAFVRKSDLSMIQFILHSASWKNWHKSNQIFGKLKVSDCERLTKSRCLEPLPSMHVCLQSKISRGACYLILALGSMACSNSSIFYDLLQKCLRYWDTFVNMWISRRQCQAISKQHWISCI